MNLTARYSVSLIRACGLALSLIPSAWAQFAGGSGTPADPYQIATATQLDAVRNQSAASYIVVADIDLSGVTLAQIGDSTNPFTGSFDGNGHTVANWSAANVDGLFGATATGATIANLTLANVQLSGKAALVGTNAGRIVHCTTSGSLNPGTAGLVDQNSGDIEDCSSSVDITATDNAGGLVSTNSGMMLRCFASGAVNATGTSVGGLVANQDAGAIISGCHATGTVNGYLFVGGLVGRSISLVSASFATGNVVGNSDVGGLIGATGTGAQVVDCYARGNVTGNDWVAGLIGAGGATRCYATGTVTGNSFVGGLTGGIPATSSGSYWDVESSGVTVSAQGTGETTAAMFSAQTYVGWDFTNVWLANGGAYPVLRDGASAYDALPRFDAFSSSQSIYQGSVLVISGALEGFTPISYQWQENGVDIPNATAPQLSVGAGKPPGTYEYTLVGTNPVGAASQTLSITVLAAPAFASGSGSVADPFVVATPAQLEGIKTHLDAHYVLGADLDMSGISFLPIAAVSPFTGTFDGAGHVISNYSSNLGAGGGALFAATGPGVFVQNLTVSGCNITDGAGLAAAIVGDNAGVVRDCSVSGSISGGLAGGVVARNRGTIIRCSSTANVTVGVLSDFSSYVGRGGLVGENFGRIRDSNAGGAEDGAAHLGPNGGLVGNNWDTGIIERSHVNGTVAGGPILADGHLSGDYVGGLVGRNTGTIRYSYVNATVSGSNAGGIVGWSQGGSITDSYATGHLAGSTGGLIAAMSNTTLARAYTATTVSPAANYPSYAAVPILYNQFQQPLGPISETYWDQQLSGLTLSGGGTGLSTAQMQDPATFAAWDSTHVWSLTAGDYPRLRTDVPLDTLLLAQPQPQSANLGQNVVLTVDVDGSGVSYQWYHNNVAIAGATDATLSLQNLQLSDAGPYTVTATGALGAVTSNAVNVTVIASPTIVTQPQPVTAFVGYPFSLSVTATGALPLSYQWRRDGAEINGATKATYTVVSTRSTDAASYSVVVRNQYGSVTSAAAAVTVTQPVPPRITSIPITQTILIGTDATIPVRATGTAPLSFQWAHGNVTVPGATSSTLTIPSVGNADAGSYIVTVTNAFGSATATSALNVSPPTLPVFSVQPQDTTAERGSQMYFNSYATGLPSPTFQWYKDGVLLPGQTSFVLYVDVDDSSAGTYTVVATNPAGSVTSSPAVLTVIPPKLAVFTDQPFDQNVPPGGSAIFGVTVQSATQTAFQWMRNGVDVDGATDQAIQLWNVQSGDEASYSVRVTNAAGTVTSDSAQLVVAPIAPAAIVTPPAGQSVAPGADATFHVDITGTSPVNVYWTHADGSPIRPCRTPIPTTITLTNVQPSDAGDYVVHLQNDYGTVDSQPFTLTVLMGPPGVQQDPPSRSIVAGTRLVLSAVPTGTVPMTLQWYKDGSPVAGATTSTLVFESADLPDSGDYTFTVTDTFGTFTTTPAHLAVHAPVSFAGGSGSVTDPYRISTVDQLDAVHAALDAHYVLTNDLDLSGTPLLPIGSGARPFTGTFDGGSFQISNWTCACADDQVGLFSVLAPGSAISNLTIANADVTGNNFVGVLTGVNQGTVFNCHATGVVHGNQWVGGLLGQNAGALSGDSAAVTVVAQSLAGGLTVENTGSIVDCFASGSVGATGDDVGGLVAINWSTLVRSHATGGVTGANRVGGLAGQNRGLIQASYAVGAVSGNQAVGGLVGTNGSGADISNAYATGSVTASGSPTGGLVGQTDGTIENSFAAGAVHSQAVSGIGGLTGGALNVQAIQNSYWDVNTTGQTTSFGGTGLTTAQLQQPSTLVGWDFSTTWTSGAGTYPAIRADALTIPVVLVMPPSYQQTELDKPFTIAVTVAPNPGQTYQWRLNGSPIAGATDVSYTVASAQYSDSGMYSVVVTNGRGSVESLGGWVSVVAFPPTITTQPVAQTVTSGSSVQLSIAATGSGTLYYQWYVGSNYIIDGTSPTLTLTNVQPTDSGDYYAIVWNDGGQVTSETVHLTVLGPPDLFSLDPGTLPAGSGDFTLTIYGSGFAPEAQVLWNGSARPTQFLTGEAVQATIAAADLVATSDITAVPITVANPGGYTSAPLTFIVTSSSVGTANAGSAPASSSETVTTSSPGADAVTVSASLQNNSTGTETIAVATYSAPPTSTPIIDVGGQQNTSQYVDVKVVGATASDVATSTFYYPASITGTAETALILQFFDGSSWQPVLSSGGATPLKDTTDNADGISCGGKFTVVFDATSTPQITQLTGTVFIAAPTPAKNAFKQKPKIVSDPADTKARTGENVSLSVTVSSVTAVTYQWYQDGKKTPIAGATSSRLILSNVTTAMSDTYYVVVTNVNGSTTSKKASLTVLPAPPVITAGPQSQTVSSGSSATFSVTASGEGTLSYQWQFNGKAIPGAKKATYAIDKAAQPNVGAYTVVVTNAGGAVTSDPATLTVNLPAIVSLNPANVVSGGAAFTLTIVGSNFVNGDVVRWAGEDLVTTFVDANTLKAAVPKNELTPAKTAKSVVIAVRAPGGDLSNSATLTVTAK